MTLKSSGYQVSPVTVTFSGTQTMSTLVDNEWTDLSDEIDNTSSLYTMADFEFYLASNSYTGSDSVLELYIIPTLDGTNYPNWTGNVTTDQQHNQQYYVRSGTSTGTTTTQRIVISRVPLPPGKFKIGVRNRLNVSTPASGNTVKFRPHSLQDV